MAGNGMPVGAGSPHMTGPAFLVLVGLVAMLVGATQWPSGAPFATRVGAMPVIDPVKMRIDRVRFQLTYYAPQALVEDRGGVLWLLLEPPSSEDARPLLGNSYEKKRVDLNDKGEMRHFARVFGLGDPDHKSKVQLYAQQQRLGRLQ